MNNKGFAISSMLYGILAITVVLLASLVAILASSKRINEDLSDSLGETYDKCAKRRVILNSCYMDKNNCQLEQSNYNACIGKKEATTEATGITPLALSTKLLSEENTKLVTIGDKELNYFVGSNPNNHFTYEGKKGRILYFESDGTMKLIFDNINIAPNSIHFDNTNDKDDNASTENLWTGSRVYNYLNEDFLNTFSNPRKFKLRNWTIGSIYQNKSFYGEGGYYERENLSSVKARVGLPSIVDLMPVSTYSLCVLDDANTSADSQCRYINWSLTSNLIWLINGVASPNRTTVENYAYSWSNGTGISPRLKSTLTIEVKPTVYISDVNIKLNAAGTLANPYQLN